MELFILIFIALVIVLALVGFQSSNTGHWRSADYSPRDREPHQSREPFVEKTSQQNLRPTVIIGAAHVIDGDTIVINGVQIRLFGIDAPELDHPYGQNAKWALVSLCRGTRIRAEIVETDGHNRMVAKCFLHDGRDLSAEMVTAGFALDWRKFSGGTYRSLEPANARKKLWLADARQKGNMHVWERYHLYRERNRGNNR